MNEKIKSVVEEASSCMLDSMKNDDLDIGELYEWYGYIRAVRDIAHSLRVPLESVVYDNSEESLRILQESKNYPIVTTKEA